MNPQRSLRATDGVELAYWLWRPAPGDDRLLVLLHGAASNHTRWSEFVEHTRLTESWSVLAPDLRGNGESMVRGGQRCSVWSRDLVEMLDAEGFSAAVVVGHSLGAQIAIHLAHRYPERVRGLVLIDPVFSRGLQGKQRRLWQFRWLVRAARALIRALNAVGIHRADIPNRDIRELDEETREALRGAESFEEIAKKYTSLRPILGSLPTANYLGQLIATVEPLPPLSEIEVPVAVLLSGGTTLADTEVNREEVARFPKSEVITLRANHWPLTEAPDETREAIEDWIERTYPDRS
ncbi:MAG: alpha/beta hydrolase [bacterium]|nr:alpha/beta hydrolase [bacterium]